MTDNRVRIPKDQITADMVRRLLDYDPDTGVLTWKVRRAGNALSGSRAGSTKHWNGYRVVTFVGYQRQEHALAWLHYYGKWPDKHLDHINGDRADNRIANLRECSPAENAQNRLADRDNKSGYQGVYRPRGQNTWRAQIKKDGVRHYLGDYPTPQEASAAYKAAKRLLHTFSPVPRRAPNNG
jgi:hypothetical protein